MSEPGNGSDWELQHLQVIETFANPWEAELARARLEGEGIAAVVADLHLIGMDWMLSSAIGGVKLKVPIEDVERAKELLGKAAPLPELRLVTAEDETQPRCPACRSEDLYRRSWSREGFFLGAIFLGFPFPVLRRRWLCRNCGAVWKRAQLMPALREASTAEEDAEADRQAALGQGGVKPG
jgi:ribosomal protein L37AE/L43A